MATTKTTDSKMKRGEQIMVLEYKYNKAPSWQRRTFYMLRDGKVSYKLHDAAQYVMGTTSLNNVRRASDFETGVMYGCEPSPDAAENKHALHIDSTTPQTGSPYNVRVGDTVIYKGVHAIVDQIDYHDDNVTLWAIDEAGDEHEWTSDDVEIFETAAARAARIKALRDVKPSAEPTPAPDSAQAVSARVAFGYGDIVETASGERAKVWSGNQFGMTHIEYVNGEHDTVATNTLKLIKSGIEIGFEAAAAHASTPSAGSDAGDLDALVALVVDQYDDNPLAIKANKELDEVANLLDAKDARIAALEAALAEIHELSKIEGMGVWATILLKIERMSHKALAKGD